MLVLHLDAYHLGDPLFLTGLARDLQARGDGAVLVHGTGERGERALEALGHLPSAVDGVWQTPDPEAAAAVEKAGRDLNREIAHELNEAGVASVRVIGSDRRLLRREDGRLGVGRTGWVAELVAQGVVVVVAAFVDGGEPSLAEVGALDAAAALAADLGAPVGLLATGRTEGASAQRLQEFAGSFPDPEAVRDLVARGGEVRVLDRATLRVQGGPGTLLGR